MFARLPPAKAANELLARWRADPDVRREFTAMDKLEKILKKAKPGTRGEAALQKALTRFIKKYPGTVAANKATAQLETLR